MLNCSLNESVMFLILWSELLLGPSIKDFSVLLILYIFYIENEDTGIHFYLFNKFNNHETICHILSIKCSSKLFELKLNTLFKKYVKTFTREAFQKRYRFDFEKVSASIISVLLWLDQDLLSWCFAWFLLLRQDI